MSDVRELRRAERDKMRGMSREDQFARLRLVVRYGMDCLDYNLDPLGAITWWSDEHYLLEYRTPMGVVLAYEMSPELIDVLIAYDEQSME